jgi:non-homologous end joining protein Ku
MKCAATASISMIFQTSRSARNYWIGEELLDLASHIIETKKARFDPEKFKDHYQEAVVDLIRGRGPLTWGRQMLRLVDSRGEASHDAAMQQASSLATQRLPVIASGL